VRELYNPLSEALLLAEDAPAVSQETGEHCPECEKPLIRRFGRFGAFFACTGFPECRYTRPDGEPETETTDELCPTCNSAMQVKHGRFGAFLACTKYPECKGTKPLLQKTGVLCPLDGGEIVQRQTRKKRTFYGCANYPACEYTSWQRPLPQVCPQCSGLIVAAPGRKAKCTNCDWSGPATQAVERVPGAPVPTKRTAAPEPEAEGAPA
jgi:DNA topoisomerase-1